MRRRRAEPRKVNPDPRYNNVEVARIVRRIIQRGKLTVAQRIMYQALDYVSAQSKRNPLEVLQEAMKNTTPLLEVRPRRVGGATYQVPVALRPERGTALSSRWLIQAARARKGKPMSIRLGQELLDAARGEGAATKRREELHRMAEANRAFAHYRW
ncbi:MAG: 30S ribosomal protein S7 [Dehalococcoidia bacterium]|nr:30S ribosomal protein S7 [Dehalococcoidia bacterium]